MCRHVMLISAYCVALNVNIDKHVTNVAMTAALQHTAVSLPCNYTANSLISGDISL